MLTSSPEEERTVTGRKLENAQGLRGETQGGEPTVAAVSEGRQPPV